MEQGIAAHSAVISTCGRYRYWLERQCAGDGATCCIMVNPSTADGLTDDATIRKIRGFGNRNLWGNVIVVNLFAYRATDIRELRRVADPVGPSNDPYIRAAIIESKQIIVAWGPTSKLPRNLRTRWREVVPMFENTPVFSIGSAALSGHPKHPLMLSYDLPMTPWPGLNLPE